MILNGTVRNIMDFGMFVDINVHQDGLVHISEVSNSYVKNISSLYSINDIVKECLSNKFFKSSSVSSLLTRYSTEYILTLSMLFIYCKIF